MMRRTATNRDSESELQQQYEPQEYGGSNGQDAIA
jgi:hypothetical protein